jgi:DNA-binding transcriptional ArsR family regulator
VADPAEQTSWTSVHLSAQAIQVLAHPLRSRLLRALRMDGPATATALAERLDTNTGATSYHLRKLASVGLVEETGEGRGRERWWRPTTEMHDWDDVAVEGDPDARAAAGWLRENHVRTFVEQAEGWLAHHDSWPIEWRRWAGQSDYALDLTPDELGALLTELWATVARAHEAAAEAAAEEQHLPSSERPDRRRVSLFIYDFPEGEPT